VAKRVSEIRIEPQRLPGACGIIVKCKLVALGIEQPQVRVQPAAAVGSRTDVEIDRLPLSPQSCTCPHQVEGDTVARCRLIRG